MATEYKPSSPSHGLPLAAARRERKNVLIPSKNRMIPARFWDELGHNVSRIAYRGGAADNSETGNKTLTKSLNRAALFGSTCLAIAAFGASGTAFAQTVPADEAEDAIIVTGTRIASPQLDNPNPVVTVTEKSIQNSGLNNITTLLAQTPALFNSETNFDAAGSQARFGAAGANLLDLRNLGVNRTLVLVNGRRHVAGVAGEAAVDINTIPVALIDRVDVLTGGVSAIYGADGVSGVVNFIMKRDFEGADIRLQNGISTYGDAPNTYASATLGKNFADGRGNFTVSYEYRRDGRVGATARKSGRPDSFSFVRNPDDIPDDPNRPDRIPLQYIGYSDSSRDGAVIVDTTQLPQFRGGGQPYDRGLFLPQSGFLAQGGSNTPVSYYQGDLQSRIASHNVNVLTSFEITPSIRMYAEGKYVRSRAFTISQPSFDFFNYVSAENPYIPASIRAAITEGNLADFGLPDGVLYSRDNFDFGTRDERVNRSLYRGVFGFEGDISPHARFDVSYVYGENRTTFYSPNQRLTDRFFAALDAVDQGQFLTGTPNGNIVCRSDLAPNDPINPINFGAGGQTFTPGDGTCRPLNIFGEGVASQAALDFINVNLKNRYKLTQNVVSGYVSGDFGQFFELPGGLVGFALGGEYRKEASNFQPDTIATTAVDYDPNTSVLKDLALLGGEKGQFNVKEAFGELRVPLFADMPLAHRLEFGAAIRFSDYSTIGSTTTWKVDGTYAPIRDVTFRGSYSEAVRAPNITELFSPQSGTFASLRDPCSPVNISQGTSFRTANCRALIEGLGVNFDDFDFDSSPASSATLPGRSTGNTALGPEKARTWTAGVVLRPSFAPRLAITFDWYDIRLKNAVNTATLQETAEFCVDSPTLDNVFCNNITRSTDDGYVTSYLLQPQNVAFFKTSGADVTVAYSIDAGTAGSFALQGTVGYLDNLEFLPANGGIVDNDRGETGSPKWVGTADVTWSLANFEVNYGLNYVGSQLRYERDVIAAEPDIVAPEYLKFKSVFTHDIRLAWNTRDDRATFFLGANNVTNKQPAIGSRNTPVSFIGRFFYAGINVRTDGLNFTGG